MSQNQTSTDLPNAISSQESECGHTLCEKLVGQTTAPCGQVPAPANLSARQAKALGLLTSGTCGQPSTGSSTSAALTSFLGNKLQEKTASLGSTLYALTWKTRATPAGRLLPQLVVSGRRTSENDCTGWPTPRANDAEKRGMVADDPRNGLVSMANLAAWPTPTVGNADGSQMAKNASPTGVRADGSKATVSLPQVASFAAWPTHAARDWKDGRSNLHGQNSRPLNEVAMLTGPTRLTVSGEMLTGLDAGMESGGQLNPAHSRWLMGLPPVWDDCAAMATQSVPSKRKPSSKR